MFIAFMFLRSMDMEFMVIAPWMILGVLVLIVAGPGAVLIAPAVQASWRQRQAQGR
jgi:hypothetical protein